MCFSYVHTPSLMYLASAYTQCCSTRFPTGGNFILPFYRVIFTRIATFRCVTTRRSRRSCYAPVAQLYIYIATVSRRFRLVATTRRLRGFSSIFHNLCRRSTTLSHYTIAARCPPVKFWFTEEEELWDRRVYRSFCPRNTWVFSSLYASAALGVVSTKTYARRTCVMINIYSPLRCIWGRFIAHQMRVHLVRVVIMLAIM